MNFFYFSLFFILTKLETPESIVESFLFFLTLDIICYDFELGGGC